VQPSCLLIVWNYRRFVDMTASVCKGHLAVSIGVHAAGGLSASVAKACSVMSVSVGVVPLRS